MLSVYAGRRLCPYRFEKVDGVWQPRPTYLKWYEPYVPDPLPRNEAPPPKWLRAIIEEVF